jgi:hypothetical protein
MRPIFPTSLVLCLGLAPAAFADFIDPHSWMDLVVKSDAVVIARVVDGGEVYARLEPMEVWKGNVEGPFVLRMPASPPVRPPRCSGERSTS